MMVGLIVVVIALAMVVHTLIRLDPMMMLVVVKMMAALIVNLISKIKIKLLSKFFSSSRTVINSLICRSIVLCLCAKISVMTQSRIVKIFKVDNWLPSH